MSNLQENPSPEVASVAFDPLSPDAPISHLLSIQHNPALVNMSDEQLIELVKRLRTLATSAPTMTAKLNSESGEVKRRKKILTPEELRRAKALEDL